MTESKNIHVIPSSPNGNAPVAELSHASEKGDAVPASTPKAKNKVSRRPCNLPLETVEYLKAWMMSPEHIAHPYPTEKEKQEIMADTGIELKQLTNWFVNNRKRYWKPLVEAKLQKQQQQQQKQESSSVSQMTTGVKTVELFSPTLISYPTSAKAMISIVPKIPVTNNFTVPFTQHCNLPKSVSNENLTNVPLINNVVASMVENSSVKTGLDVFELAVNYLPHTFTSTVSENSSLNDEDEDSATAGEGSISSSAESHAMKGMDLTPIETLCHAKQMKTTKDVCNKDSLPRNKRITEDIDLRPRKITKISKWREVCSNASTVNDSSLPSLDEAAELFGFRK